MFAQRDLGTLTGTVVDAQGSAVANAKVTITNEATGVAIDTVTTETGSFTRPALNPGSYTVSVEAPGFQRAEQKNILVSPNEPVAVNLTLQVGNSTQVVEVTAAAPLLQTESPVIGTTLNNQQVTDLPLGGQRTFTFLARLTPGVQPAEPGARDALGGGFSANGVRSTGENNFLLNGVDNNVNVIDFINQTAFIIGPAPEAIGDMQIISNGADAQYGRAAGGILEISLKSGTNQIHGSVWEILSNTDFDANKWENNKSGLPRNKFNQNQFGGAAGGPILKNRLFIFGDYQGTRIRTAGGSVQNLGFGPTFTIPTPAERSGDFSGLANTLYDPTSTTCVSGCVPGTLNAAPGQRATYSRKPYANNTIPVSQMDPVAMKLAALYPNPNTALANCSNAPAGAGCYAVATPGALNTDQGDGRVDWRYNDANSIFGTISWADTSKTSVPPFPGALDGGNFQGSSEQDLGRNGMLSWTHTFSATMVNEARVGFSRLVTARTQANANTDVYKELGIGGYDPTTTLNGGAPQIDLGRYSQVGANNWLPTKEYNNEWDMIENLSIVHGNHQFKMGAEFRQLHFPFFQVPYPHGELSFGQAETGAQAAAGNANALAAGTGDEFASFLLGSVDTTAQISTTNFISSTKQAYAFYFMDNWKVTPKLTLNLGARYELFSPIGEQFSRQSNFDFDTLTLQIPTGRNMNAPLPPNFNAPATVNGVTFPALFSNVKVARGQVGPYLIPWDKTDIGPRLGFAYNIEPKTVIRGFFGMFYGGEENQGGNPNRGESAPFNQSPSLARPGTVSIFQPDPLMANGQYTGALTVGFPPNVFNGYPVASLQFREVYPDFRNPLVQEWNLAVQHQLPGQMALEVGYEGNHQARQLYQPDPNACPTVVNTGSLNCTALRPYPDIGSVSGTTTFGFGNYEAMTAALTKRLSSGLQGQLSYTYGHALSDTGTTLSGSPGFFQLDGTKIGTSYSSAPWDIRHAIVGSFNYEIPFGRGKKYGANLNKVVQSLVGNWQLNGILSLRTGQPFTLNSGGGACGNVISEDGGCMPTMVSGQSNPNQAPSGGRSPNEWFNTANFVPISQLTQGELSTQGNTGLNSNVGPPQRTFDFSVFKDFNFTERWKLEFRAESTNITNTPQYSVGCVSLNQNNSNFGDITCTNAGSERHIDFQLRLQF
ncbi:MAG: carboxypeptidase regulatory-like domain-containing protein [Acidobacteriaceae bacterium]|nr:carboxypeptidase regulatory-like domain-containing protein [Acidobacteriaceae bacterium]